MKTSTRPYRQTARAAAAEETRRRILDATVALQTERLTAEVSLDAVARHAGVSVQTVLRRFGSRDGLVAAAIAWAAEQIGEERTAPVGDVAAAVRVLVDHYERRGDLVLLMLSQESAYPHVRAMTDTGRTVHRRWVSEVFAPQLADLAADQHEELVDLLVVATDVYAWKLLRRDRGLSRREVERRMERLAAAVLPEERGGKEGR